MNTQQSSVAPVSFTSTNNTSHFAHFRHFGKEILKQQLKDENSFVIDLIFNKLYEVFVEAIDAYVSTILLFFSNLTRTMASINIHLT